jgi:alpha-1,2-mannosyltransferase
VAVFELAALIWAGWYYLFLQPGGPQGFVDLDYYRTAIQTLLAQQPLADALPYPPIAVLVIAGLGGLPVLLGNQLWTAASFVLALLVVAVLTRRALQARGQDQPKLWDFLPAAAIAGILLLTSWPMFSQISDGQLSLVIIGLSFLDLAEVLPKKAQGVLVGLAAAIKLTPLIFIPYYLVTGQRRQAAVASASFGFATAVGFALFPGDSLWFWTHLRTGKFGDPARIDNLSIQAALVRWLPGIAGQAIVWMGLGLVVAGFAMWRARNHFRSGERMEAALTVGAAAVVISPISWPHYHVWVILAALWLVAFPGRHRLIGAGVLIAYSLPVVLLTADAARAGNPVAMAAWDLEVVIPILIGVFGLPHRPVLVPVQRTSPSTAPALASEAAG